MKILLLGADGQLGFELRGALAPFATVLPLTRATVDLSDAEALTRAMAPLSFDAVVNAASYNEVDPAETDLVTPFRVNRDMVRALGVVAKERQVPLLHYSTDFVFDGSLGRAYMETDPTGPLNCYAQSKLAGEQALLQDDAPALIFRTAWVYSFRRKSFVSSVLKWAEEREEIRVVDDQIGSPTWSRDLARTTAFVLFSARHDPYAQLQGARGVYHLAGTGSCSRYQLARAAIEGDPRRNLHKLQRLLPVPSSEFPLPAKRPLHTPLDCTHFERTFGLQMPAWEDALQRALADRVVW